ncbi:MAG: tetratricopeptide repeat protein [Planctomycetota bacterium]|jgi:tetratricopeptide (TPR) repeat protein
MKVLGRPGLLVSLLLLLPACRRDMDAWRLVEQRQVSRVLRRARSELETVHSELKSSFFDSTKDPREKKTGYGECREAIDRFVASTPPDRASQATAYAIQGWLQYLGGLEPQAAFSFARAREVHPEVAWSHVFEAMARLSDYGRRDFVLGFSLPEGGVPAPGPLRERPGNIEAWISFLSGAEDASEKPLWGWMVHVQRPLFARFAGNRGFDHAEIRRSFDMIVGLNELAWFTEACLRANAKIKLFQGDRDGAIEDLHRFLDRCPKNADAFRFLGFLHLLEALDSRDDPERDLAEAVRFYTNALTVEPDHADACYELSNVHLVRAVHAASEGDRNPTSDFMSAIENNQKALHFLPEDFRVHATQGYILHALAKWASGPPEDRLEHYTNAVACYDKAMELKKDRADVLMNRGLCRLRLAGLVGPGSAEGRKLLDDSIADQQGALGLRADPVWVFSRLGETYRQRGKGEKGRGIDPMASYRKSLAVLDRALAWDPDHLRSRLERGHTYVRIGMADHAGGRDARPALRIAVEDYRSACRAHPGDVTPHWALGRAFQVLAQVEQRHKGDPKPFLRDAVAHLLEAARLAPEDWPSLRDAGVLLQRLGRHRKAAEVFEIALAIAGGDEPSLKKRLEEARKKAKKGE